ncbi:MAG TPA: hypothetical protein VLJ19_08725 [Variovorax sp.]|nr:hypothetical protein [Variovorax sp.]
MQDFSDTQSLLPCKRCAELLQEGDRFCRYCGQDQLEPDVDELFDVEPARATFAGAKARAPLAAKSKPSQGRAAGARALQADVEIKPDLAFPGAVWQRQADRGRADDAPIDWSNRSISPSRLALGISAALLLALALVLVHDLYVEWQGEPGAKQSLKENVEQVQGAVKEAIDQQIQELAQERDRLRAAITTVADPPPAPAPEPAAPAQPVQSAEAVQAARAAAPPAPIEQPPAPPAQTQSPEEAPATAAPAARSNRNECSQALAALALCPSQ